MLLRSCQQFSVYAETSVPHDQLPQHSPPKPHPGPPQLELEMKPYRPSRFGQEAASISPRISAMPTDLLEGEATDGPSDHDNITFSNEDSAEEDEQRGLLSSKSFGKQSHGLSRFSSFNKTALPSTAQAEEGSSAQRSEGPKLPYPKGSALSRVLAEERSPRESRATEEEPDVEDTAMHKRMQQWWANFDDSYMQPVFGGPKFKVSSAGHR